MKRMSFLILAFLTVFGMLLFGCTQGPGSLFSSGKGSMQIKVTGLPQRAVQATLSDIDHILINLETARNATASQTLTQAALYNSNASASIAFPDLWPGEATVSVTVYNTANNSIGTTTATATVIAGQVTTVNLSLKLSPTDILAGNLAVVGTILPAPTPIPGPPLIISSVDSNQMIMANALDNWGNPQTVPCTRVILDYNPCSQVVTIVNNTGQELDLFILTMLDDYSGYSYRKYISIGGVLNFIPPDANGKLVKEISVETYQTYLTESSGGLD